MFCSMLSYQDVYKYCGIVKASVSPVFVLGTDFRTCDLQPLKTNMTVETKHLKMYFLLTTLIFECHVSFCGVLICFNVWFHSPCYRDT